MKQVISIAMSLLLLLSSSGLTYAQHFCGDLEMISKITLGEKHLSCGMTMQDVACGDEHSKDHHCCKNQFTSVDTDDNFATTLFNMELYTTFVAALVSVFILEQPENYNHNLDYYKDYSPPPLGENLQVLYATFLI